MIALSGIKKSFGGVRALKDVNMRVAQGEIHALLGENGAGKSTLMKIVSGALPKDAGTISIDGEEVDFKNTQAAKNKGVGIIYQEFSLVPELSVAENIYLHRLKQRKLINWKKLYRDADSLIRSIDFVLDVKKKVKYLSVAQQQIVEIAKALSENPKLLILDEPSAVLGPADIQKLFSTLRSLRDQGVAVIYISHHLEELFQLVDAITVLKDGATVATLKTSETSKDELVELMLGRTLSTMFPDRSQQLIKEGAKSFRFSSIQLFDNSESIEFEIKASEIVGIGGLVGSGRTELLRSIFAAESPRGRVVYANGHQLQVNSPLEAVRAGIGMVPEDRKQHGGMLTRSIAENISLTNYKKISNLMGFINQSKEAAIGAQLKQKLNIKIHSLHQPLSTLSGGNQQKVILAKWLNIDADLLLIDEPTRGVDVGAKAEIYSLINQLAENGMAILMVSSDWEELMELPDRVLVMRNGCIQGELSPGEINQERLLRLAIGEDIT